MSQYRDDRAAARLRIEALEARLADREAELAKNDAALAARDAEILRLQREFELAFGLGPRRMRSVSAAWASRIVGATTGLALLAAGAGATMVHAPATGGALPIVVLTDAPESLIHADPLVSSGADWTEPSQVGAPPALARSPLTGGAIIKRQMEPRVWGGRPREDDLRLHQRICADDADDACRERARAELLRARGDEP
jgi:hypothetical protein